MAERLTIEERNYEAIHLPRVKRKGSMIEYFSDGRKFTLSYKELRGHYLELCGLSDEDFLKKIPQALHLACVICFLKEIPVEFCLTDRGIIHELVHLISLDPETYPMDLKEIRKLFEETLRLA